MACPDHPEPPTKHKTALCAVLAASHDDVSLYCSPQGVAQGLTQMSRQMQQLSSSRNSEMQASREGVTPCGCCCCFLAASAPPPPPAPARGGVGVFWDDGEAPSACWSATGDLFSCSRPSMVRLCVRGLHVHGQAGQGQHTRKVGGCRDTYACAAVPLKQSMSSTGHTVDTLTTTQHVCPHLAWLAGVGAVWSRFRSACSLAPPAGGGLLIVTDLCSCSAMALTAFGCCSCSTPGPASCIGQDPA